MTFFKYLIPLLIAISIVTFYFTGLFVIQPMGALPEGVTIWFNRYGTNLPFICSADGLLLKSMGNVSLLGRMIFLGEFAKLLNEKEIMRFPYSETLYLFSTNGQHFEK